MVGQKQEHFAQTEAQQRHCSSSVQNTLQEESSHQDSPALTQRGFNCRVPQGATKLWLHRKGGMPRVPGGTGQVCIVAAE